MADAHRDRSFGGRGFGGGSVGSAVFVFEGQSVEGGDGSDADGG